MVYARRLPGSVYIVLLALWLAVLITPARAQVLDADSLALVALYNSTNGVGWTNKTNWLTGTVDTWYGVTTSGGGAQSPPSGQPSISAAVAAVSAAAGGTDRVVTLDLSSNNLAGPLPVEIGDLTSLFDLDLSGNKLTGAVPIEMGALTGLGELILNNNQLIDLPDLTSAMTGLWAVYLQNNRFTFEDIEPYAALSWEVYDYSPQDSVGSAIDTTVVVGTSLTLEVITGGTANQYQWSLNGADFTDGPITSGATDSAVTIYILDPSVAGTYALRITNTIAPDLTLYSRPIEVTVQTLLHVDSLALVALYNSTDGANWTTPWTLSDPVSAWNGVTVSGGRVTQLNLNNNNLVGPIPVELASLTGLVSLWLYDNQLTGTIPTELGSLTNLASLYLYSNGLTGPIPVEIGSLTGLVDLRLNTNLLASAIPVEIGTLTNLTNLNLGSNQLTGAIPTEISSLTNLTSLALNSNQLTSAVPTEISSLTGLTTLVLSSNQLTGLPDLSALSVLSLLIVQSNQFTFEDLEPNIGVATTFTYTPQDSVGTAVDTTIVADSTLTFTVEVGGAASDVYQWTKDGADIPVEAANISGVNDSTMILFITGPVDAGSYVLRVTNTVATALTLHSRPFTVTVIDTTAPAAPQNLAAAAGNSEVTLTWSPNTDTDFFYYRIYGGTTASPTTLVDSTTILGGALDTTRTLTGLTNGTTYYYRVTAVDVNDNESDYSDEASATPFNTSPEAFALLSPGPDSTLVITSANLGDTLTFAWEGAVDADGDIVCYGAVLTDGLGALFTLGDTTATEVRLPYAAVAAVMENLSLLTVTGTWDIFAADGTDTTWASNGPLTLTIDASTLDVLRQALVPETFALHPNYPNPFNPSTTLRFDLPEAAEVYLVVYDLLGREVARLVDGRLEAGYHSLMWNGSDARGREVPTGMYIARLVTASYTKSIKLALLK